MKPSPVVSILLFIGTAALLASLLGRGWIVSDSESMQFHSGPVWGEICIKGFDVDEGFSTGDSELRCKTHTFLSNLDEGNWDLPRVLSMAFVLLGLAGIVCAGLAGISLLSRPRSSLALAALCTVGGAFTILSIGIVYVLAKDYVKELPVSWGFYVFMLGSIVTIVGSIMGLARKPTGGMRPPLGPPHRCGNPGVWVAQSSRWFCPPCNEYL